MDRNSNEVVAGDAIQIPATSKLYRILGRIER
jgi:hypothetical protein